MSENTPETPAGRAWVRYVSDDPTPVALPEYLNPLPGVISGGDVFSVNADRLEEVVSSDRFEVAEEPVEKSPNEALTKAELAEKLSSDGDTVNPDDFSKADLVTLADTFDRLNPQPPGGPTDTGNPEGTSAS